MDFLDTRGLRIQKLGFGTFRTQGDECRIAVESALELGYQYIDTAKMYANEGAVGEGIGTSGIPRSELHITTKVWHDDQVAAGLCVSEGCVGPRSEIIKGSEATRRQNDRRVAVSF